MEEIIMKKSEQLKAIEKSFEDMRKMREIEERVFFIKLIFLLFIEEEK